VQAVYEDSQVLGSVVAAESLWAAHTVQPTYTTVLVDLVDGVTPAAARASIAVVADQFGGEVQDVEQFTGAAAEGLDMLLGVVYVLLALAVLIALLGIANALSLAVHERRREIGLLRAVGQTRRQVRSVLRLESTIVSLFGTVVGLGVGAVAGVLVFATVSDAGIGGVVVPVGQLSVIAVVAAVAGVLAALRPARRAARLPILDAIAAP
nr:ABC transporter permease [Micromonospora sp. DSM 115978]